MSFPDIKDNLDNNNVLAELENGGGSPGSIVGNGNTVINPEPDQNQNQSQSNQEQQQQREQQQQEQSAYNSNCNDNHNANCNTDYNANGNANCNANENVNLNSTCVSVSVDVSANVTPLIGDLSDANVLYMPQNINFAAITGNGNEFALDQLNSLVANNTADGNSVSNFACGDSYTATNDGSAHAGDIIQGDLATGAMTANTSTAATVDAFTQSIVLGANLQNNSFTATIAGGDQTTNVGNISAAEGHHHS
jgi:hypothetical protein